MHAKIIFILAIISVLALSACEKPAFIQEYLGPTDEDTDFTVLPPDEGIDVQIPDEDSAMSEDEPEEEPEDSMEEPEEKPIDTDKYVKKIVFEGDLVELSPEAVDPDGDDIEFTYSAPLDEDGTWQTKKGDAGQYLVDVTASDGRLETTQKILIVVQSTNNAPTIDGLDDMTVEEGDTVELEFTVEDEDGDDVEITISGWIDEESFETGYDDAGEYDVTVIADDGEDKTKVTITVTVENVNRAPVFEDVEDLMVVEEDEIKLRLSVDDPDGDEVELSYSDPFDEDGEWQTEVGDEGEYEVTVTASDGTDETEVTFTVEVKILNAAPEIAELDDIEVDEGETVLIEPEVSDADGDDVEVTFSGWMDEAEYETDYDDSGEYTVTVTASDGKATVSRDVSITVNEVNRPPEFVLVG